ncbi:hypothetical protein BT96DRAFT_807713, partial [Gymnopus androsaceus JB14]
VYSKATKSEISQNYDSAFGLYIKAAESFLNLCRSASATENEKLQWKKSASRALERAERIKQITVKPSQSSGSGTSKQSDLVTKLTPVAVDYFSPEEQSYVLKKGSNVNGIVFPSWHEKQAGLSSVQKQPKLSSLQIQSSPVWRIDNEDVLTEDRFISPHDISQNIVTDCSVCASISCCLEHDRRFGSNVSIVVIIGNRLYDLKLLYNGDWRRIRIDGQLPYNPESGVPLCLTCKAPDTGQPPSKKSVISWPSILEKGYMVLMGGYDFPGSNSAIDLHALTGWIPEHIDIKRSNFEGEKTWTRILEGFVGGRCMLTFGTGSNANIRWRDASLLSTHSYAVIDVREEETGRFVTILDSWVHSESADAVLGPNVLEIPWLDVLDVFDGIYLNWDPQVWPSKLTYHAIWRARTDKKACTHHVRAKIQSTGSDGGEIWVLLTRHVNDTRKPATFIACNVEVVDDEAGCSIVCNKQKLSNKGTYTNNPHVLTRTKIPPLNPSATLSVLAMCEDCSEGIGFDVTIYAPKHLRLSWEKEIPKFPLLKRYAPSTLEGNLTSKNAGGNHTHPTFMINPQYHLHIHPSKQATSMTRERTTLLIETNKDLPVQVLICWSQGERVNEPSQKSIAATSGRYTHGLARVTTQLSRKCYFILRLVHSAYSLSLAGDYTVIVSAFEPHQTGPYTLAVNSFARFSVAAIPQEGAGMYRKTIKGTWDASSAAGAPSFNRYFQNPIYELIFLRSLKIRLQLLRPSSSISLNVTVYPAVDRLSSDHHVMTSGAYDDPITGVVTPLTSLAKGRYWVVPSTYNPETLTGFQLIVFSTLASIELVPKRVSET